MMEFGRQGSCETEGSIRKGEEAGKRVALEKEDEGRLSKKEKTLLGLEHTVGFCWPGDILLKGRREKKKGRAERFFKAAERMRIFLLTS